MSNLLSIFWNLVIESAPWLLLGYFIAGVIKQVIPSEWVQKQLAKPGHVSDDLAGANVHGSPFA